MCLKGDVASQLMEMIAQLSRWTGKEHVFYTQTSLHTTICTIEFYRSPIEEDDESIHLYVDSLKEICRQFAPLQVRYQGLTAIQTSILVQGWPLDESLQKLRLAFHDQLRKRNLLYGPEKEQVRELAHASLISFSGALLAPQQCVSFIEEHRETNFGVASASSLEIVRYQQTVQGVEPTPLATVPLLGVLQKS